MKISPTFMYHLHEQTMALKLCVSKKIHYEIWNNAYDEIPGISPFFIVLKPKLEERTMRKTTFDTFQIIKPIDDIKLAQHANEIRMCLSMFQVRLRLAGILLLAFYTFNLEKCIFGPPKFNFLYWACLDWHQLLRPMIYA